MFTKKILQIAIMLSGIYIALKLANVRPEAINDRSGRNATNIVIAFNFKQLCNCYLLEFAYFL